MNHLGTNTFTRVLWLPIILLTCLSGCVAASDWLSGPTSSNGLGSYSPYYLEPIQIDVSTQEDVSQLLGYSIDRQHSHEEMPIESWAYISSDDDTISPQQYIPFLGAYKSLFFQTTGSQSVAISFSPHGIVSGLTVSSLNAYGDIPSPTHFLNIFRSSAHPHLHASNLSAPFYGMKNPLLSHSATPTPSPHP